MHLRHVAGLVSILVLGAAIPASAQLPASTTDPAPEQGMPPPAGPDAAWTTGPATPANTASRAPGYQHPGAGGTADASGAERNGVFARASLAINPKDAMIGNLQAGWMFGSQVGVFGSIGAIVVDDGGAAFKGVGVRLSSGAGFAEAQIAWLTNLDDCDSDEPCGHRTTPVAILGAGMEVVHLRHFGLEVRGQIATDGRDVLWFLGFGPGVYF